MFSFRRAISQATNGERPKDLEGTREVIPKQSDPKETTRTTELRHIEHSGFLNALTPIHFYNSILFLISDVIFLTPGLLIKSQSALILLMV